MTAEKAIKNSRISAGPTRPSVHLYRPEWSRGRHVHGVVLFLEPLRVSLGTGMHPVSQRIFRPNRLSLVKILASHRGLAASDPRDNVFALFNMSEEADARDQGGAGQRADFQHRLEYSCHYCVYTNYELSSPQITDASDPHVEGRTCPRRTCPCPPGYPTSAPTHLLGIFRPAKPFQHPMICIRGHQ